MITSLPEFATRGAPSALLCSGVIVLLSLAAGRRVLIVLGAARGCRPAERGVLAACLGLGLLPLIPIGLGAAGLLRPPLLRVALAVTACALAWDLSRVLSSMLACLQLLRRPPLWVALLLAVTLPAWGVLLLSALSPTIDPDGLIYHLTVPKRWLEAGSLRYLPTYPYSNTPMGAQSLFAIALANGGDSAAKCLTLAAGMVAAVGVFLAGRRLSGLAGAATAMTLLLLIFGSVPQLLLLGSAYIEPLIAMAMCGAILAWILWIQERDGGWLRCAALLAGVSVSFKITAVDFAIVFSALTIAVVAVEPTLRQSIAGAPARLAAEAAKLLGLAALPVAPWMIRAGIQTGNPFFPMLSAIFPTRDLSPESAARFSLFMRYFNWKSGLLQWSLERRQLLLLLAALAMCLGMFTVVLPRLRSGLGRAVAIAVLTVCLLHLSAVGLYIRLWVPLLAALTIPFVFFARSFLSASRAPAVLIALAAAASTLQMRKATLVAGVGELGLTSGDSGRRRDFLLRQLPSLPLYELVNQELPGDARILLSGYSGGFYIDRTTFATDFVQDSLRFTTWNRFLSDAHDLHITHVIAPVACNASGFSLVDRADEFKLVSRLTREHGRLLARASDLELYAVDVNRALAP